jgi:hypothetical protein
MTIYNYVYVTWTRAKTYIFALVCSIFSTSIDEVNQI